jgi:hypothetical protein
MKLVLPENSTLWSAYVSDRPVKPSIDKDGTILIPLDRSSRTDSNLTSFTIDIVYFTETKPLHLLMGRRTFRAPITDIQTDAISWTLYLPDKLTYSFVGKDMEKVTPVSIPYGGMEVNAPAMPSEEKTVSDEMTGLDKMKEEKEPQSQVYMERNVYAEGLLSIGGGAGMKGVLPVRLDIPFSGYSMSFTKVIVKPGEESTIKVRYAGGLVSGILLFLGIVLFTIVFGCPVILGYESLKERRFVIERRLVIVFGAALLLALLLWLFLILPGTAIWWGLIIAVVIGVFLFGRDLAAKLKAMVEQGKLERARQGKEQAKSEKKNEK